MKEGSNEEEEEEVKHGGQRWMEKKEEMTLNPAPMKGRAPVTRGRDAIPGGRRERRKTNQMTYRETRVTMEAVMTVPLATRDVNENM